MKIAFTAEQKWVTITLGAAALCALPSFWMSPRIAGAPAAAGSLKHVDAAGSAVPILETDWSPRSMSGDEQHVLQETLKVDINHIDEGGLVDAKIPGIGPGTAAKVIAYREAKGCFHDIEEIRNVKGLGGEARFDALKDLVRVDLAGCVFKDGEVDETAQSSGKSSKSKKKSGGGKLVNINTATVEEILDAKLPKIGKKTAEKIVEYRNEHGSFGSLEELMEVPGIKEGTFEKIKHLVTLN